MLNQCIFIGRLVDDPQPNFIKGGIIDGALIKLAVQRTFKNVDGGYDTDFIIIKVADGLATAIQSYCKSGVMIAVKARVESNAESVDFIAERISYLSPSGKPGLKEEE